MDITSIPADPAKFLETTASNVELATLAHTALSILAKRGVSLPPTLVDEVEEVQIEALAREPGGLKKLLKPKLKFVSAT